MVYICLTKDTSLLIYIRILVLFVFTYRIRKMRSIYYDHMISREAIYRYSIRGLEISTLATFLLFCR